MKERFMVCKMTIDGNNLVKLSRNGLNIAVDDRANSDFPDKESAEKWIANNKHHFKESKPSIVGYYPLD